MSVITVSGGWFRGGKQFAESLANNLGFRCIGRETLIEMAASGGASEADLRAALLEPPSLFDRLITHKKYLYLSHLQAALAEEVQDGNIVYHGYAGHLLLSEAGPVFRIRIVGSMELRIKAIQEETGLSRDDAAVQIHRSDQQRKKWTHYLYGVDWEDPYLYDMVLNVGHLFQLDEACAIVTNMIKQSPCFRFTPANQAAMRDFAIASRVRAELAVKVPTVNSHVQNVQASDGKVTVSGVFDESEQITEIERIVRAVPGVTSVDLNY